jgi:hypothetical protein
LRLHVLVEGPSEAAFLRGWFPRLLPQHALSVVQHRGKGRLPARPPLRPDPRREGLLDQLPAKLRAYGRVLDPTTDRLLVFLDLDNDSCVDLKRRLLATLASCDPRPVMLFRIAIEELEAFYLGDMAAVRRAFPQAKSSRMKSYIQDSICGTWELFQEVIKSPVEDKVEWAERMARYLGLEWKDNNSPSFQQFCRGLRQLTGEPVD